jgi:hypothetical protein
MEDKLTIKTPIPATSASRILSPVSRLSHSPQTARLARKLRQNSRDFLYHSVLSGYFLRVFVAKARTLQVSSTLYKSDFLCKTNPIPASRNQRNPCCPKELRTKTVAARSKKQTQTNPNKPKLPAPGPRRDPTFASHAHF